MIETKTEKGGVLSVQESAQYLGVSRSSFWRKAKSDSFPSKVVINNKVGYRPEDLEEWHSKQVANREAKRSGVQNYEFFGRVFSIVIILRVPALFLMQNVEELTSSKPSSGLIGLLRR